MTKSEFYFWAKPRYEEFLETHSGVRPSVDRIDSYGHYELGNLQVISFSENSKKAQELNRVARYALRLLQEGLPSNIILDKLKS